jgi:hypothetical protein
MPFDPYPDGVVVTKVMHFDISCWKIAAAGGTFYFENGETEGKSGFNSAFDMVGNDWIGNDADKGYNTSPKGDRMHEWRGWPNFGEGDFDHPARSSGASTRWVDEAGNDVAFVDGVLKGQHLRMRSSNDTYELEYHFFRSHAAIKILRADDTYAFLFEGPIGGEQDDDVQDVWVLEDGTENEPLCSDEECFSPFIYFKDNDPNDTQVWYLGAKNTTPGVGGESRVQSPNMTIVSYGRVSNDRSLTGTDAISVFGFYSKAADHATISAFINARLADPFTGADPIGVMP